MVEEDLDDEALVVNLPDIHRYVREDLNVVWLHARDADVTQIGHVRRKLVA